MTRYTPFLPGCFTVVLVLAVAFAADPNQPHEHQGILTPYTNGPPALTVTSTEAATLAAGQVVTKQLQMATGGRGVAIMDIHASPETIWSKITDFSHYPQWVSHVTACGNYRTSGHDLYTRFVLDVWGIDVEYYIHHVYRPDLGWMTWTLDYGRLSDLDDSVGYWRLAAQTADPPLTRVEYSADIRLKGWVPGVVADLIAKKGLTDATSWVKKQSEAGG